MATEVKRKSGGEWWRRGEENTREGAEAEVREMAMGVYDTAVICEHVIRRMEAHEKKCLAIGRLKHKDLYDLILFRFKAEMLELSRRVFLLADPKTQKSIRALGPRWMGESEGGSSLEFETETEFVGNPNRSILRNNKGKKSTQTKSKKKALLGKSKGSSSMEFESDGGGKSSISNQLREEQFMKLLASISKSVVKSIEDMTKSEETVVPPSSSSFKLGLISSLFDEMWDDIRQIDSTKSKVLATCVLTPLARHIAALRLISADTEWLCTWVPEFARKLQHINADEEIEEEEIEDGEKSEEHMFAAYIRWWEQTQSRGYCCRFEDPTILSSMLFTHYKPDNIPFFAGAMRTMQIFSIKVTILEDFKWPLEVYGVVAARDAVDYRRNVLFLRTRDECQYLKEHDSFLQLIGPSRAIVSNDTVKIEVQLKVKGATRSADRSLITTDFSCNGIHGERVSTRSIDGYFCRIDLCCQHLGESIQATILGVRVKRGSLPSKDGIKVLACALSEEYVEDKAECTSSHIVLLDQKDAIVFVDEEGYLDLSRQVVSVKVEGRLEVLIKTFTESGDMSACAVFTPQFSNISEKTCFIGECELEIIVAWSVLVDDQQPVLMMSYTEPCRSSPFPFMKLDKDAEDGTC